MLGLSEDLGLKFIIFAMKTVSVYKESSSFKMYSRAMVKLNIA